jgi:DnaJ-class molecular chaperone
MATYQANYGYGLGHVQSYSNHYVPAWSRVLDVSPVATLKEIKSAYRKKAMVCHPDHGGSESSMQSLNEAYHDALKAREHST